jgi:hypothetical protein
MMLAHYDLAGTDEFNDEAFRHYNALTAENAAFAGASLRRPIAITMALAKELVATGPIKLWNCSIRTSATCIS